MGYIEFESDFHRPVMYEIRTESLILCSIYPALVLTQALQPMFTYVMKDTPLGHNYER